MRENKPGTTPATPHLKTAKHQLFEKPKLIIYRYRLSAPDYLLGRRPVGAGACAARWAAAGWRRAIDYSTYPNKCNMLLIKPLRNGIFPLYHAHDEYDRRQYGWVTWASRPWPASSDCTGRNR
jgi:hypothetical protein